ncbi:MAG TPA: serine hydrolase domain-containing protein [Candidatus Baltobacteraceae bacterium]|jgi:CubicO group peptidase (beta-lactamase class C family)
MIFFLLLVAAIAAPAQPLAPDTVARVDTTVTKALSASHIPGMSISVSRDGTIVYSNAYGYANLARHTPATVQTHYEIGSITKQFTATGILQLKEAGKLSLDDTIGKWIPQYARGAKITIRELLQQTTGIPDYTDTNGFEKIAGTKTPSFAAMLGMISGKPLLFAPGSRFSYSNTNYIILGEILERASHTPWESYVRSHLFAPAGMTSSGFIDDEASLKPMATGYGLSKKGVKVAPPLISGWAWSAGAIVSTVDDMQHWDAALLRGKLINQTDLAAMFTPGKSAWDKGSGYAFGWVVDSVDGHKRIWHNGGTFGFLSANLLFPKDRVAIVALQNGLSMAGPESTATRIFEALEPSAALATSAAGEDPAVTARLRSLIAGLESGTLDRSQLTPRLNARFSPKMLAGIKSEIGPLGAPQQLLYVRKVSTAKVTIYTYRGVFAAATFNLNLGIDSMGKVSGITMTP